MGALGLWRFRCSFHVVHVILYNLKNIEILVARLPKGIFNVSKIGLKLVGAVRVHLHFDISVKVYDYEVFGLICHLFVLAFGWISVCEDADVDFRNGGRGQRDPLYPPPIISKLTPGKIAGWTLV